jgi:hypothetical protein
MHAIAHSLATVLALFAHLGHAAGWLTALDDSISSGGPT